MADGILNRTKEPEVLKSIIITTNKKTNNQIFIVIRCLRAIFFSNRVFIWYRRPGSNMPAKSININRFKKPNSLKLISIFIDEIKLSMNISD